MIEVEHEVVVRLRRDAAIREMPVQSLIRELLDVIAHENWRQPCSTTDDYAAVCREPGAAFVAVAGEFRRRRCHPTAGEAAHASPGY